MWLFDRKFGPQSFSYLPFLFFLPLSSSPYVHRARGSVPAASGCNPSAALRRSKFRVNSIFAARDFSVEFLGAVRKTVMGIRLQSLGFSIIRDKRDFDSTYLAISDEIFPLSLFLLTHCSAKGSCKISGGSSIDSTVASMQIGLIFTNF